MVMAVEKNMEFDEEKIDLMRTNMYKIKCQENKFSDRNMLKG